MTAYYNEHDPIAAQWLRNLIKAGHIASGVVDERDIQNIRPDELTGFKQCHFFAGIGVWSYALRQAGWPDDKPVWTGSCPCQPFSTAGKGKGTVDDRHLWPYWFHLIESCRPEFIFGEQVASKDGLGWLDIVQADLEGTNYTSGAVDMCAAGFGAPHIRQRLWFVAKRLGNTDSQRLEGFSRNDNQRDKSGRQQADPPGPVTASSSDGRMADTDVSKPKQLKGKGSGSIQAKGTGAFYKHNGCNKLSRQRESSQNHSYWRDADWLWCRDGKWRPAEPGTFPLAHGITGRVGRLRAYGNAICAEVAAEFIKAFIESNDTKTARTKGSI